VRDHRSDWGQVGKEPVEDDGYWQKRADEARKAAESLTHPATKRELLLIARRFEMLARQARKRSANRKGTAAKSSSRPRRKKG
jgi:hypothetical protein